MLSNLWCMTIPSGPSSRNHFVYRHHRSITGAIIATPLLNGLGLRDWRARGFAAGVAAHGLGTARAFQVNDLAGTSAGIGMALNALATAIRVPVLWHR